MKYGMPCTTHQMRNEKTHTMHRAQCVECYTQHMASQQTLPNANITREMHLQLIIKNHQKISPFWCFVLGLGCRPQIFALTMVKHTIEKCFGFAWGPSWASAFRYAPRQITKTYQKNGAFC